MDITLCAVGESYGIPASGFFSNHLKGLSHRQSSQYSRGSGRGFSDPNVASGGIAGSAERRFGKRNIIRIDISLQRVGKPNPIPAVLRFSQYCERGSSGNGGEDRTLGGSAGAHPYLIRCRITGACSDGFLKRDVISVDISLRSVRKTNLIPTVLYLSQHCKGSSAKYIGQNIGRSGRRLTYPDIISGRISFPLNHFGCFQVYIIRTDIAITAVF